MEFERLEATVDAATREAPGADTPIWEPLEAVIGKAWWGSFMWMGSVLGPNGTLICLYKNGMTRNYLNVGSDLKFYRYCAPTNDYDEIPAAEAYQRAFADVEKLGGGPNINYDENFIGRRTCALRAKGYKVISATIGEGVTA